MAEPPDSHTTSRTPSPARAVTLGILGAVVIVVLGAAVWYATIAIPYFRGTPTLSRDYVAELNALASTSKTEDRAWPLYREAVLAIPQDVLESLDYRSWPPDSQDKQARTETLSRVQVALALAREGAARPTLGFKLHCEDDLQVALHLMGEEAAVQFSAEEPPLLIATLSPSVTAVQVLSRWLLIDAFESGESAEAQRMLEDLIATVAMADHLADNGRLISQLLAFALANRVGQLVRITLSRTPDLWTNAQLRDLADSLRAFRNGTSTVRFDAERIAFLEIVQHLYTDDGCGDGIPCAAGFQSMQPLAQELLGAKPRSLLAPFAGRRLASRKELLAKHEQYLAAATRDSALPLWQRKGVDSIVRSLRDPMLRGRFRVLAILAPAVDRASASAEIAKQQRDATLTTIALERFRREHQRYPASLEELMPDYLAAVSIDRFTGDPLAYRLDVEAAHPILYSCGADRDDDAGEAAVDLKGNRDPDRAGVWHASPRNAPDGDWVLWPLFQ